jgi:uncharacterized protein (DUF697 family)
MSINKKKLPKAMRSTDAPTQASAPQAIVEEKGHVPDPTQPAQVPSRGGTGSEPVQPTASQAAAPQKTSRIEQPPASRGSPPAKLDVTRRRTIANAIVERHATYAVGGGIIPLPIANVAGVTAINIRMVSMLSRLYDVPFERDRTRAMVVGLAGGAMPMGLATVAASTLSYLTPASALIALAVSSLTAATCTRNIGRTFVEHFESGAASGDLAALQRREASP